MTTKASPKISPELLRAEIEKALDAHYGEKEYLSLELAAKAASKIADWTKLFGFFLGIPTAVVFALLAFLGIKEYSDLKENLETIEAKADSLHSEAGELESRLGGLRTRTSELAELEQQVGCIWAELQNVQRYLKMAPSELMTPTRQQRLQWEAASFHCFLIQVGLEPGSIPTVDICKESDDEFGGPCSDYNAWYDLNERRIVIGALAADDIDAFLYNYALFAQNDQWPTLYRTSNKELAAVPSGFADFLTCSYTSDPLLGEVLAAASEKPALRDLRDDGHFEGRNNPQARGGVWASILWEVAEAEGHETAQSLAFAWVSSVAQELDDEATLPEIAEQLLLASREGGASLEGTVRAALEKRAAFEGENAP